MAGTFKVLKNGGGGFMTGLDLLADGTKMCKCDQYGCWIWNPISSVWDSLLTPARGFTPAIPGQFAAYDMAAAPSNSNVIYIFLGDMSGNTTDPAGHLYRSLDKGASFVQLTNFIPSPGPCNNGTVRFNGRRIAVDPINPDVLYVSSPGDGQSHSPSVQVTSNGTQGSGSTPTFSNVTSITTASGTFGGAPAGYNIAFDPNGGSTSGKSNVVAVFSGGVGLFTTSSPLGTFTLQNSGTSVPTSCSRMVYSTKAGAGSSTVYVADDSGTLHTFAGGSWSTLSPGISAHSVTVDPNDNTRIVVADNGGQVKISTNSGVGWNSLSIGQNISPTIPWLGLTQDTFRSNGDMLFDPALTNTVTMAEGIGIYTKSSFPNTGSFQWTVQTDGIENMTTNALCASPNTTSTPTIAKWDRFAFNSTNQDAYPASQLPNNLYSIQVCWDLDWASSDGKTIVGLGMNNTSYIDASGTSSDDGQTWTFMPPCSTSTRTVTTSGASSAGSNTLTIATQPFQLGLQYLVSNATHPTSIPAGTYITGTSGSTVSLSKNIASPGVSSGDTINVSLLSSGVSQYIPLSASALAGATTLTFASSLPSYIKVGMIVSAIENTNATNYGGGTLGILSISGNTITLNAGLISGLSAGDMIEFAWPSGGCVAASSPTNFMLVPFPYPMVTADGGSTWEPVDISGVPRPIAGTFTSGSTTVTGSDTTNLVVGGGLGTYFGKVVNGCSVASITNSTTFVLSDPATGSGTDVISPDTGWGKSNFLNHKIAMADRVTPNKFYLYNFLLGKLFVSTSSGANGTWSVANTVTTNLLTAPNFNLNGGQVMAFKTVPNNAGHMFASNASVAFAGNNALVRSTDGGATWTAVSNVTGVNAFGFGKPMPGGIGYPTIFIYGQVSGVKSFWRSDDNCATWVDLDSTPSVQPNTHMGYYPNGSVDIVASMDGDKNVYGRVYFGYSGSGSGYFSESSATSTPVAAFSVIHGRGKGRVKMIGY